jgi:hypothetical protein
MFDDFMSQLAEFFGPGGKAPGAQAGAPSAMQENGVLHVRVGLLDAATKKWIWQPETSNSARSSDARRT